MGGENERREIDLMRDSKRLKSERGGNGEKEEKEEERDGEREKEGVEGIR